MTQHMSWIKRYIVEQVKSVSWMRCYRLIDTQFITKMVNNRYIGTCVELERHEVQTVDF